jgi:hypothetical protein
MMESNKTNLLGYSRTMFLVMMFATFALLGTGCDKLNPTLKPLTFGTEYQAVFMDNGQTFFGKIENAGTPYPLLKEVYYIQREVNKDTNEVRNILVKRGSEWHGPEYMYINAQHIVVIEPVNPTSRVAQLIKEAKSQAPTAGATTPPADPEAPVAPAAPK